MAPPFSFGMNSTIAAPMSGTKRISDNSGKLATLVTDLPHEQVNAHKYTDARQHEQGIVLDQPRLHAAEQKLDFRTDGHQIHRTIHYIPIE
jgi:hypothetical protein